MVLIIVFAPSGRPTPYCKGPAHSATDSFFAATTDFKCPPAEKRHHEKWSVPTCGVGEERDMTSLEALWH